MENTKKYHRMSIKRSFLLGFVAFALGFSSPAPAHAADSWLEFFFPSLKQQKPDPSQTGMAEFADENAVIAAPSVEDGLPENSTPLHIRHRPSADVAKWIENVLPDLMSFEADHVRLLRFGHEGGVEGRAMRIHAPLISLTKAEIIRQGTALGVDYSLTHSCYDPINGLACGRCDACRLRRQGFEQAGIKDPTRYHDSA